MKKKELLGIILLLGAALALSGCSSVTYSGKYSHRTMVQLPGMNGGGGSAVVMISENSGRGRISKEGPFTTAALPIKKLEIKVLGTVTVEADGISTFLIIFESGDNGYAKLFAEAKKKYPEMDALVNIMEDVRQKNYFWLLYFSQTRIITATAVKYVK